MAACFAARGFEVVGADVDSSFVAAINEGRSRVEEPGLAAMLAEGSHNLRATTDTAAATAATDATFVIVPTPSDADGRFALDYVLRACKEIGRAIREMTRYHLVVITSTVMPGSTDGPIRETLERASGKAVGAGFGLCYSPEFIALGTVIRDLLDPDFVLIGESDERAGNLLAAFYARVCNNDPPAARMSFVNAELAKIAVNTYVTSKIAFANMLARMCERLPGADVDEVTRALGMDSRIGQRYLRGAIAYGGPCFPRDNLALAVLARAIGAPATIAEATDASNRLQTLSLADVVASHLPDGGKVAVLGLAYKPDTSVVEESAGLLLALELARRGIPVVAYDPAANETAQRAAGSATVEFAEEIGSAIADADVIVVATPWPEFGALAPEDLRRDRDPRVLVDCWRMFDRGRFGSVVRHVVLGASPRVDAVETSYSS
jgi:UDPglucose 6-dehydrogenase